MSGITRFGVSIETELLERFDHLIHGKGYGSRSEAIRDLIRDRLVREEWTVGTKETVGTITLVYNHETRELSDHLTHMQHGHHELIISSMHVHMDARNCLEVLVVRGKANKIRQLADRLIGTKGVKHGKLTLATAGKGLA
ncbi:MAG: nickel-responsive transcriptional regulator NikR [Deltaproteobacteria bacterium]|nr:nickel-responsive transcriptional regulator NikR [Deltaproteobacteria bacterium]